MENADPNNIPSEFEYGYSPETIIDSTLILFIIILIIISIYIYVRRHFLPVRHHHHRRPHFIFYIDPESTTLSRGLEASVIASLPIFAFSSNNSDPIECAVCLSEFENGEMGRVLPSCKHSFHIQCIDMWFMSHSTCPLCRVLVESPPVQPELIVNVSHIEPGSSSEDTNRVRSSLSLGEESLYNSPASSFQKRGGSMS